MSDELRWEDPPVLAANRSRNHPDRAAAAALRARPGEWAIVSTSQTITRAQSKASFISRGKTASFGAGFDAVARTVDGEHRVYVRYVARFACQTPDCGHTADSQAALREHTLAVHDRQLLLPERRPVAS